MSTTKDIKQKASIEERIGRLERIRTAINSVEYDIEYWLNEANEAEPESSWWRTCQKNYSESLWLKKKLEEIASEV